MKTLELSKGAVALVDDDDFDRLSKFKWSLHSRGYAIRVVRDSSRRQTTILMHREAIGALPGQQVDHRNGDRLDNQKSNLRTCTAAENGRNKRKPGGTSAFKGVSWRAVERKWVAQITTSGGHMYLGLFVSEEDAARAYDTAAREHFGEFAATNFSDVVNVSRTPRVKASRFRGVFRSSAKSKPWTASVRVGGKGVFIGNFCTEEEAAKAYDVAAVAAFGERAKPNFPDQIAGGLRLRPAATEAA